MQNQKTKERKAIELFNELEYYDVEDVGYSKILQDLNILNCDGSLDEFFVDFKEKFKYW